MKFLIDAHLPPSLREVFRQAGHGAIHTLDLPERNSAPDRLLNEISVFEERVVVTKDTDFYYSHVLQNRPWKLVLVRTDNPDKPENRSSRGGAEARRNTNSCKKGGSISNLRVSASPRDKLLHGVEAFQREQKKARR